MSVRDQIEKLKADRAERLAFVEAERDEQELKDRQKLDELEAEHGSERIGFVEAERHIPGFPVLVIVRMPSEAKFKRYQDRVAKKEDGADIIRASTELGLSCVLYPERDILQKFDAELPGIAVAAGGKAAQMCGAKIEALGKK